MENRTTIQSPDAELQYIKKIIEDSRANFAQSGEPYVAWGLLVAVGMGITYLSLILQRDLYTAYVWSFLIACGWVLMFYFNRKRNKALPGTKSIVERIDNAVWTACAGSIGLLVIAISATQAAHSFDPSYGELNPLLICFFSAVIMGISYFASGVINQIPLLRNLAFAWWSMSLVMALFSSSIHVVGIYAATLVVLQVLPGIILNRRYRRIVEPAGGKS